MPLNANEPPQETVPGVGHNSGNLSITIELRSFNRIHQLVGDGRTRRRLEVAADTTVGELLERYAIPENEVIIAFVNGRDISASPGVLRCGYVLEEGDVLALFGPVPYSWGYGAPVV